MAIISYADDMAQMASAYATGDYSAIQKQATKNWNPIDIRIPGYDENGMVVGDGTQMHGFRIQDNEILSNLYGFPIKVVRFASTRVNTSHEDLQQLGFGMLCNLLRWQMETHQAYYCLHLPANIMDMMRGFQECRARYIFCGGTVALTSTKQDMVVDSLITCDVKEADQTYLSKHADELMELTKDSFDTYQGQYHIAPKTAPMAGKIYENWMETNLQDIGKNRMFVAEVDGHAVGFGLVSQKGNVAELELTAVSPKYRGQGIYKSIIAYIYKITRQESKQFIASTQLDNYASQSTWASLGMKPYFTFYNMHFDMLEKPRPRWIPKSLAEEMK